MAWLTLSLLGMLGVVALSLSWWSSAFLCLLFACVKPRRRLGEGSMVLVAVCRTVCTVCNINGQTIGMSGDDWSVLYLVSEDLPSVPFLNGDSSLTRYDGLPEYGDAQPLTTARCPGYQRDADLDTLTHPSTSLNRLTITDSSLCVGSILMYANIPNTLILQSRRTCKAQVPPVLWRCRFCSCVASTDSHDQPTLPTRKSRSHKDRTATTKR
jgi:hypothetical protein